MRSSRPLHLFEGFGVELEYMIVDRDSLAVLPVCDDLLCASAGAPVSEVERGVFAWSNELVQHAIEVRNTEPVPQLAPLASGFQAEVRALNRALEPFHARLMPGGMHPWMDPARETHLWEHEYQEIYQSFHRIFNCRTHGWANVQSVQLNLPFGNEEEFGRLHAAVRLLLPILPALAASSPIMEGKVTGLSDNRLEISRTSAAKIAAITGRMIPEPVFSFSDYQTIILQRMYRDISPYDPKGVLQHEWLNARAAIARFDRSAIEVRLMDIQEYPAADIAICRAATGVLLALVGERWTSLALQQSWETERLESILLATVRDADRAVITDRAYLEAFGFPGAGSTAEELWRHLARELDIASEPLQLILDRGPLARRLLAALGDHPDRSRFQTVYQELCHCLESGTPFGGSGDGKDGRTTGAPDTAEITRPPREE
jgi:hypothetical protein